MLDDLSDLIPTVEMDKSIPVILERYLPNAACGCWNSIYNTYDIDCKYCRGTGTVKGKRNSTLIKAAMVSAGGLVDDGDPVAYAYTHVMEISCGDIIVCKGRRYKVIEITSTTTMINKPVLVCGLDYERDYNHNQADLERYK